MYNKEINIHLVAEVATGLQELREQMVFVGGAVISLYTDDPAADEIRPTTDIDMTINVINFAELAKLQERLIDLGFYPNPAGKSICAYQYNKIDIDIMPAEDSGIGIANTWYKPGFEYLEIAELPGGITINILPAPYFLATKLEAFNDRGNEDYYGSHDFEDIIYLLDNRTTIVEEILASSEDVKQYIKQELSKIKAHPQSHEIMAAHIHHLIRAERIEILTDKFEKILQ